MTAVAWWGYSITIAVLILLLGGMFVLVRVMSDDTGAYEEIKKMLDPIFHTPAFLRPGSGEAESAAADAARGAAADGVEPFEDVCPGCGQAVTHRDAECPSCGLRLLG